MWAPRSSVTICFAETSLALNMTGHFDGFDLVSVTGLQKNNLKNPDGSDNESTAIPVSSSTYLIFHRSLFQELYASSSGTGLFSLTVGGTYYRDRSDTNPQVTRTMNLTTGAITTASITSRGRTRPWVISMEIS